MHGLFNNALAHNRGSFAFLWNKTQSPQAKRKRSDPPSEGSSQTSSQMGDLFPSEAAEDDDVDVLNLFPSDEEDDFVEERPTGFSSSRNVYGY